MSYKSFIPFFLLIFFAGNAILSQEDTKCLTFPIQQNKKLSDKVLSTIYFDSTGRPKNQTYAISSSGLFVVHYDTTGENRVPPQDKDKNGIPDYVDSALFYLDYAFSAFTQMGFDAPPTDSGRGGSDAYDFYLWEIGNGFYDEVAYGWTVPDLQIKTSGIYDKFACYSIIDNNFSQFDSTFFTNGIKRPTYRETEFLGLKITLAHELHHLFQFGYGDPLFPSFNEMTSTFMELRLHPETKDYLQFVRSLFSDFQKYVLSDQTYYVGYRYAIFLQYLYLIFGDFPIVELWRNIGRGNSALLSLDLSLKSVESSLSKALANFLPYIYYSGSNTRAFSLPNAELFPSINFYKDLNYTGTTISTQYLRPLEIMPLRFNFPASNFETLGDTLVVLLANIDSQSAINQIKDSSSECTIILSENPLGDDIRLYPKELYYSFKGNRNLIADSLFLTLGFKTIAKEFVFPNPCNIKRDQINFPVPKEAPVQGKVELKIFNSDFMEIALPSNSYDISIVNKTRVVHFDKFPINLPTGIYFFKVSYRNHEIFGKFTLIK